MRQPKRLERLAESLIFAERKLALVESLSPINFESEVRRLSEIFVREAKEMPSFRYEPRSLREERVDESRVVLSRAQSALKDPNFRREDSEELATAVEARLEELWVEADLVSMCGTSEVRKLSARRYRITESEMMEAHVCAREWLGLRPPKERDELLPLSSQLIEIRNRLDTGVFVHIVEKPIAALSAVGGQTLYVRTDGRATAREARRIWVHEVEGHLLPRVFAKREPVLFSLGTAGCAVDEEGRAVLLEERNDLLSGTRKRELAARFVIAAALLGGGEEAALEACRSCLAQGVSTDGVARSLCRVARGGGLAREIIYLPGYLRVKRALEQGPGREALFRRGRASVEALAFLERSFVPRVRPGTQTV